MKVLKRHIILTFLIILSACNGGFSDLNGVPDGKETVEPVVDKEKPVVKDTEIYFFNADIDSVDIGWSKASDKKNDKYDAGTDDEELEYRILFNKEKEISDENVDESSEILTWTRDLDFYHVTGLDYQQDYHFNVQVRDKSGNISTYRSKKVKTNDFKKPGFRKLGEDVLDKIIVDLPIETTYIDIHWYEADDNKTKSENLEYCVMVAPKDNPKNYIITTEWGSYTSYIPDTEKPENTPYRIEGLNSNTNYTLKVLVRDEELLVSSYKEAVQKTKPTLADDVYNPVIPDNNIIIVYNGDFTVNVTFKAADDEGNDVFTVNSDLKYKIVRSLSEIVTLSDDPNSDFETSNSVISANNGWTVYGENGLTLNNDELTLSNIPIADGTTTYFAVAVKDNSGNSNYYYTNFYDNSNQQSSDLIAHWKFQENDYIDFASSRNCSSYGLVTWVDGFDGRADSAVSFNGASYLYIDDSIYDSFYLHSELTVSAWIKVPENWGGKAYQNIISKGNDMWRLQRNGSSNNIEFAVNTNSGSSITSVKSSVEVNDDTWHHIVGTYNQSTGFVQVYVDGVLNDSAEIPSGSGDITCQQWKLRIGNCSQNNDMDHNDYTDRFWIGSIDDIRIYKKVLSDNEIKILSR